MRKNDSRSAVVRRHLRLRKHISGTAQRPRLNVFRSLNNIYAQVIDDEAKEVGKLVAKRALEKGIDTVVFDRGGYIYHGRVQALAEGAREAGLKF